MALKERLSDEDFALIEVLEDPVWSGEFLRSTSGGEINKELWPKQEFKYRWYQKDLLTDRSPFICAIAGRAVGKCQPTSESIYTDKGYKKIYDLAPLDSFLCYAMNAQGELQLKRAKAYPDVRTSVYEIETESGRTVRATGIHPILTPSGWVKMVDLKAGDYVGVATRLPELNNPNPFKWHELRWLGYFILTNTFHPARDMKLKFQKHVAEMKLIARKFNSRIILKDNRTVSIVGKIKQQIHPLRVFMEEIGMYTIKKSRNTQRLQQIPNMIMELPNDALKILLESMLSLHFNLAIDDVWIQYYKQVLRQIQELLLRFGIETHLTTVGGYDNDQSVLRLADARARYRLFTTFDIPGVTIGKLPLPPPDNDYSENLRYEEIVRKSSTTGNQMTYAIYVHDDHNYISNNVYVHNSLVLEDKIVHSVINADIEFPQTKEQLLATANQAQLIPILDRIITRFSIGKVLKSFLQNQVNKSQGVLKFPPWNFIFTARIAAGKGESNLVGLHIPKIIIDESQLFTMAAYTQLLPALNS